MLIYYLLVIPTARKKANQITLVKKYSFLTSGKQLFCCIQRHFIQRIMCIQESFPLQSTGMVLPSIFFQFFHSLDTELSPLLKYQFNNDLVTHLHIFLIIVQRMEIKFVFMTTFVTCNISSGHFPPKLKHPSFLNYYIYILKTFIQTEKCKSLSKELSWISNIL